MSRGVGIALTGIAWTLLGCWSEPLGDGSALAVCEGFSCEDGLTIYVVRRDEGRLVPGEYLFAVDGETIAVACRLESDGAYQCDDEETPLSVTLNPDGDEFTLRLDGAPETLAFDVSLDGDLIGAEQLVPAYRVIVPPNPECPETCLQGTDIVEVEAPEAPPES